ncbi:coenzyme F420-0:L-glutamate ligase [Brachybacterium sp. JHP9]|uniref:Coenzyme F420-0:L-glutamate ligase n=1 Tax=Brachybacterium equifaecis TaxID=2910770 RepID=A0ABT0R233_9MICO|nr:coenzyme F420-0:L-glutamate ligase [Brachybacterium equifaecis]MCL6423956.1 coenzyme F420-0:L-glutamate ligase [Brachybacterium equifaecis]
MDPTAEHSPRLPTARAGDGVQVLPVRGIAEVTAGADLVALLLEGLHGSGLALEDGDVLCVSTKIVSKSLGLTIPPAQKQEAIESQSVRRVARRRHGDVVTSIVEVPAGPVMAAAGIDGSNAPGGLLLLPEDPYALALDLARALRRATDAQIAVVLTDTSSRIWRVGVSDIALGAAGIRALEDLRGQPDASGRALQITMRSLADELAAAADLVKGKAEGIPAALVRGVPGAVVALADQVGARSLSRSGPGDWFPRPSLESVWEALGVPASREPVAAMDPEPEAIRIARALEIAALALPRLRARAALESCPAEGPARGTGVDGDRGDRGDRGDDRAGRDDRVGTRVRVLVHPASDAPRDWADAGALAERIRTALGAEALGAPLGAIPIAIVGIDAPPGLDRTTEEST